MCTACALQLAVANEIECDSSFEMLAQMEARAELNGEITKRDDRLSSEPSLIISLPPQDGQD